MNKLKWISEEEQQEQLRKRIKEWKEGQSKDGFVLVAAGKFEYKGIKYLIRVIRYYNHTDKFCAMMNRVSDKHAVVECPKETEQLRKFVTSVEDYSEFLYHDTLHSWNDNQTVEDQIKECHKLAKSDIDGLNTELIDKIDEKIEKLKEVKEKIRMVMNE